jgi:hypothetical protein
LLRVTLIHSICFLHKTYTAKAEMNHSNRSVSGRKPVVIPSIYTQGTRNSSISSQPSVSSHRPSTTLSSISTNFSNNSAQTPVQAAPPAPPTAPQNIGVLLLVIAGSPSRHLKSYVQSALVKDTAIAEVLVVGEAKDEQAIKQLKVELYGLAGNLKRELSLRVELSQGAVTEDQLRQHLSGVLDSKSQTGGEADKKELHGVLCDLDERESQPLDVLEIETAALMDQWLHSVGFVHAVARTSIPLLRVAAHRAAQATPSTEHTARQPFFATTLSSSAAASTSMHTTGLRTLLDSLSTLGNREITFASADILLAPEPEPIVQEHQPVVAPTNGWSQDPAEFSPGESPTKLWGMWSQYQDQEGSF